MVRTWGGKIDWGMTIMGGLIKIMFAAVGVAILCAALVAYKQHVYEKEHPCVAYGEERLEGFVTYGATSTAIYKRPCLKRAAEEVK